MNRREIVATVTALTLGIGAGVGAVVVEHEINNLPGSYKSQIKRALGASGIQAHELSLETSKGTFTFHQGSGLNEQTCTGVFGSNDGVHADISPLINCEYTDGVLPQITPGTSLS